MALAFYPRLKCSTEVSERHVMLIFEKIPGGKFGKRFFERWGQNMELIICIIFEEQMMYGSASGESFESMINIRTV